MDLSLAHRHYETFDLEWHELGDQSHILPVISPVISKMPSTTSRQPSNVSRSASVSSGWRDELFDHGGSRREPMQDEKLAALPGIQRMTSTLVIHDRSLPA